MSGVCGAMSGEGGWNRSGFRTAGGEGGAGKWLTIFLGAFFLTMVGRRRADADRLCLQVGPRRFFLNGLAGVYTRWLVNDTQDAP